MKFVDTHAHLDCFVENGNIDEILKNANNHNVEHIITCSTTPSDWIIYEDLAKKHPNKIYWQIGIHPTEIGDDADLALDALSTYFIDTSTPQAPVAIGEIGLDFYRLPDDQSQAKKIIDRQYQIFRRQLNVAVDFDLKVCIHARNAVSECITEIKNSGLNFENVVFHCFSGTLDELKELNDLGGRASFTGILTYKNAQDMRDNMLQQGLDKIMFETDCPYLSPTPHRGKTCEPYMVAITAEYAAQLFGISKEDIAKISTKNAQDFFNIGRL